MPSIAILSSCLSKSIFLALTLHLFLLLSRTIPTWKDTKESPTSLFSKDDDSESLASKTLVNLTLRVASLERLLREGQTRPNKFFLDCGANTGSTYALFHDIWPDPEDFHMISFEIDPKLAPFYAGLENHTAVVPIGVSNESSYTEGFLESSWDPNMALKNKFGGGTFFTRKIYTHLTRKQRIPTFDLSSFVRNNFNEDDYVVLKLDIEGSEYAVIDKMLRDGSFKFIDYLFLEFHELHSSGWSPTEKKLLRKRMENEGIVYHRWDAEYPMVVGAEDWQPSVFGNLSKPSSKVCSSGKSRVKIAIAGGLNRRKIVRLIETVLAHSNLKNINIALFLYRDFIRENVDLVTKWFNNPRIVLGSRGDAPRPQKYFAKLRLSQEIKTIQISSLRQIVRITGHSTEWYLPDFPGNKFVEKTVETLGLKFSRNVVWVPPKDPEELNGDYSAKISVGKTALLLDYAYRQLKNMPVNTNTWLVFDSDFDETWTSSVFILDFLNTEHAKKLLIEPGCFISTD